jgi:hypothetical protein
MPFGRDRGGRRSLTRCGLLGSTIVMLGCSLLACSGASNTAISASSLKALALEDAKKAGWVHEVVHSSTPGHRLSMENSIGSASGQQIIDVDGAHATVVVLKGKAFLRGNTKALTDYFQLFTTHPQMYAGKWISVPRNDSGYLNITSAVTLKSDFGELAFDGPFREGDIAMIDGLPAVPILGHEPHSSGSPPVSATLDVTATGEALPIEFLATNGRDTLTTTWSDWGRPADLPSPTHPIAISTINVG